MNFNLMDLLNQIKKFAAQEKGDSFSLIAYFFLSLVVLNRYFGTPVSHTYESYGLFVVIGVFALCIIARLLTRRIEVKKNKINIAIAQFNILNTSMEKMLDSEQKLTVSTEISNYICNCLNHAKQDLRMDNDLNFLRLPSRITINYATCDESVNNVGVDILLWGICNYVDNKFYINYKVCFKKQIDSVFFQKLVHDINAYPDIPFTFAADENLEFDKFIHMVSYLSIAYKAMEFMNKGKFAETEQLLKHGLSYLYKLYEDTTDQSVNTGDKDVVKVEILMYFILSKNYFNRAHHLLESFDYTNEANKKLDMCSDAVTKQIDLMNTYLHEKKYASTVEQIQLENEYVYRLSQLGKTKTTTLVSNQLKNASAVIQNKYKLDLVQGFIETKFKDFTDAKKHYMQALESDPKNIVALRSLGLMYYELGDLNEANKYLQQVDEISHMHIFQTHLYDIKLQKILSKIALKKGCVFHALFYISRKYIFQWRNHKVLKKMYVL